MKKLIVALLTGLIMSLQLPCFASDGTDLDKEIAISESMITGLTAGTVKFSQVSGEFSDELKGKLDEKKYIELQGNIKNTFGSIQGHRFVSFTRFDQADRLQFICAFDKEKMVSIISIFDKKGKLLEVAFMPVKEQKPEENKQTQEKKEDKPAEQKPAN